MLLKSKINKMKSLAASWKRTDKRELGANYSGELAIDCNDKRDYSENHQKGDQAITSKFKFWKERLLKNN